jgi:hypothetical protein
MPWVFVIDETERLNVSTENSAEVVMLRIEMHERYRHIERTSGNDTGNENCLYMVRTADPIPDHAEIWS